MAEIAIYSDASTHKMKQVVTYLPELKMGDADQGSWFIVWVKNGTNTDFEEGCEVGS